MSQNIERLVKNVKEFYAELEQCRNDRYLSWEHCYDTFDHEHEKGSPDVDKLCLHLAFYLASWGMYRGSSFLLQRDYLIHRNVVKVLLDKQYSRLWGISAKSLCENCNLELVIDLFSRLSVCYGKIRTDVSRTSKSEIAKADVSQTLITKVLMGTLGCCPAYDRYFVRTLKEFKFCQTFSKESLNAIAEFYVRNNSVFNNVGRKTQTLGLAYPQMKILDMAFWKCGYHLCADDVKKRIKRK